MELPRVRSHRSIRRTLFTWAADHRWNTRRSTRGQAEVQRRAIAASACHPPEARQCKAPSRAPVQVRHGLPIPISPFPEMLARIGGLPVYRQRIWWQWNRTTLAPAPETIAEVRDCGARTCPSQTLPRKHRPMLDAGDTCPFQRLTDEFGRAIRPRIHGDNLIDKSAAILRHISLSYFHPTTDRPVYSGCRLHIFGK